MRAQELDHRAEQRRVVEAAAQRFGSEPGQGQQPPGACRVRQHPAERAERQRLGIGFGKGTGAENGWVPDCSEIGTPSRIGKASP